MNAGDNWQRHLEKLSASSGVMSVKINNYNSLKKCEGANGNGYKILQRII